MFLKLIKLLSSSNKALKAVELIALLLLFKNNIAQNLIRNGSFESYTEDAGTSHCVTNFSSMYNWQQIQSPDVFVSSCTFNNHYGSPNNRFGNAYPINGNAYIGIGLFILPYETKEYIFQHLNTPLVANKLYYVSFFISKADRVKFAVGNIGAYISVTQPTVINISDPYIIATPQVENQTGFITDTISWTRIEGYFTAQGGEEYITIGNFNSNADTDTINTGTTNPIPFDAGTAYYYLDSVSLYDALTMPTGLTKLKNETTFNLYPNPSNGRFILGYKIRQEATLIITDISGREISRYTLAPTQNKLSADEQTLQNGIYFYHILVEGKSIKTDKIVVIK